MTTKTMGNSASARTRKPAPSSAARIVDMRLRPPLASWVSKPQFGEDTGYYPTRLGFPRPRSAMERSMDLLLAEMDEAGIRYGVVMGRQSAPPLGRIPNEEIADLLAVHPDRFIGVAGVDVGNPRDALAEAEKALNQGVFRGISIEPGCSSEPMLASDPRMHDLYALCQEKEVPISIGLSLSMTRAAGYNHSFASPLPILDVAATFPKLTIVVSHAAWPFVTDVLAVAFVYPNVFVSPDLYQNTVNMPGAHEYIRAAKLYLGDRLLFGTAYPSCPLVESVSSFNDWNLDADLKERILFRNAERLFSIEARVA